VPESLNNRIGGGSEGNKVKPVEFKLWEVLERKILFRAHPWFEVWCERVRLPDGRVIPDYYKLEGPNVAAVVAMTVEEKIVILRQYKHGVGGTVWELPAGFCNENESALDCGQRELLEETGYRAERWINLGNYVLDANRGGGSVYVFLALDARKIAEPNNGDLEEYEVHYLKMADLLTLVRDREIKAVGIIAAILLAHLHLYTCGAIS